MSSKDIEAGRAHVIIRLRDQVSAGLKHVERSLSGFGRNFATLGAAMTAGSAGALAFPLKMAADMEQMGIALEVLLGNADAAKAVLKGLSDFAKATPFSLADVGENTKLLLAYGVSANQIIPNLKTLGDVALGDKEKFDRLSLAFGQTQAKGRLMGQEVLQMTEAGFNPLQEISRTTGVSVMELSKRMENGEISAAMLTRAFQTATGPGGRFAGGMERMSGSAYGMMGKLMDAVSFGLKPLGDAAVSILKPVVGFATDVASAFQAFAEKNKGLMKAVAGVLIGLVAMGAVLTGVGLGAIALSTAAGGVAMAWGFALSAIMAVFSPMGVAIGGLILLVVTFRSQIASAFAAAGAYMQPLTSAIARIGAIFWETFGGMITLLMSGELGAAAGIAWLGFVAAAWQGVLELGNAISAALGFLSAWIPGVDGVTAYVSSAFASIGQAILSGRWDIAGAILMAKLRLVITEGWNSITAIWTGFTVGLAGTWDAIISGIQSTWRSAVTEIAKWLVWIAEQAGFSMQGVKEELDKMNSADQGSADKAKAARDQARYDAGAASIAAGEARAAEIRNQIAELEGQASSAYASAGAPTIEDAAAKARAALEKAIKDATDKKDDPIIQPLKQQVAGGVRQMGTVSSSGTFSAAGAAASLGFNARPMEDTAKNTRRLVALAERNQGPTLATLS
jgi:tape measure domain-containing protein